MTRPAQQPDSLEQVELLMALEEEFPDFDVISDALERWKQGLTEEQAFRLLPHVVKPTKVRCVRNGFETEATLIARRSKVGLALDEGCRQFAVGVLVRDAELHRVHHFPTIELALRSFEQARDRSDDI